ncbi:hypothetical protein Sme01_34480 [Sphaerisporangium melleum]|uniref:Uncharacterized protein n=1 Tax=Sphaerisporangium melleum TaxID=321316 RepID=A0A917VFH5_9ACTN|nr:hypothetical protein [Sphaerisporangium melleum]GGK74870.1 hypothetical protein GCM10007964_17160 [Sphaerisporangium melleum]GII70972.1 hypothetical protein Sme01_34480 [Sphaerisporangium melleum]
MKRQRPAGRHHIGAVPRIPHQAPRRWDPAKRAAAAQLDQIEPAWTVFYGVGSRRFTAIALWQAPTGLRVEATTTEELRMLMREAEMAVTPA